VVNPDPACALLEVLNSLHPTLSNFADRIMKIVKQLFKRETFLPIMALVFASAVSSALIVSRAAFTGNVRYLFLGWNLFLAWLPLVFAIMARDDFRQRNRMSPAGPKIYGLCAAWLLFFPNAPYICTDLVHLTNRYIQHFWLDLAVILSCAFTGLILGMLSLYLMHSLVTQRFGKVKGWLFVLCVSGLSSFGIYLGRFLRFNSWHVLTRPDELLHGIGFAAKAQLTDPRSFAFLAFFSAFTLICYVMLYAMAHLPTAMQLQRNMRPDGGGNLKREEARELGTTPAALPVSATTAFQEG
jgi:uncharacterized membrane protein